MLTLRVLEARYGRLTLTEFRGLYERSPALAVCFLVTGLASIGFPCTLGFVGAEMFVDGAVGASPVLGVAVASASTASRWCGRTSCCSPAPVTPRPCR